MEYLEFIDKLREDGKVRYAGQKSPGMTGDYVDDPQWPYMNNIETLLLSINSGRFTYEKVRDAIFKQLDRFNGNAYGAFAKTHDGGNCISYFLISGKENQLQSPIPTDTRFAPANSGIQLDYLSKQLDLYGNPMVEFHRNEGAAKWASHASKPPYNAFDVKPETARWLLLNNLVSGGNDRYSWLPYVGLGIAEAVIAVEKVNHPGVAY